VTQELLDQRHRDPFPRQLHGERVAEGVSVRAFGDAGPLRQPRQQLSYVRLL
jgi:hypothetical protein